MTCGVIGGIVTLMIEEVSGVHDQSKCSPYNL